MPKTVHILLSKHGATLRKILVKTIRRYSKKHKACNDKDGKKGCMPWDVEEKLMDKHFNAKIECNDCKPRSLIDKITMTVCEKRKMKKCMKVCNDYEYCKELATTLALINKKVCLIFYKLKFFISVIMKKVSIKLHKFLRDENEENETNILFHIL